MIWNRLADRRLYGPFLSRISLARCGMLLAVCVSAGCYSFSGGGGLPSSIKTAYVAPVVNSTNRFGLSELLSEQLLRAVRQRLGLKVAAETEADAIIRATIRQYTDIAINFGAQEGVGADVSLRRVTVGAQVEIYDVARDVLVWDTPNVSGVGEYVPGDETEEAGQQIALENLVQKIVDGAQSQW